MPMSVDLVETARAVGVSESVAWTVKFDVPLPVGVPLMTPVDGLSVRPAGSAPDASENV